MAPETSTELVEITDPDAMVAALRGDLLPLVDDPVEVVRAITDRILGLDDPDAVLDGLGSADKAQDVIDRPFTLQGVRLMRSAFDEGQGVFALLAVTYADDGVESVVTCSSAKVMAKAVQLARLDALPRVVVIRKADKATAAGFYPLDLASA